MVKRVVDAGAAIQNTKRGASSPKYSGVERETPDGEAAVKKYQIDKKYDQVCAECTHLGRTWQAGQMSSGGIIAKHHHNSGTPPETVTWHDANNSAVSMSWADFTSLKDRIYSYHEDAFANKQSHKSAIDDMLNSSPPATASEIADYNFSSGWPT